MLIISASIAFSLLVLGYCVYAISRQNRIKKGNQLIAEARLRAASREGQHQFMDTNSDHPWTANMELDLSLNGNELDDSVDGRGELTDEQKEVIGLIMEGHSPRAVHNPKPTKGPSAQFISGYTASSSVFSSDNQVEKIDPNK